ncbi:bifunctional aspartate kinase/homoserine dehydrogenase I [Gallaecimonas sp. GXIMD4217]|uniref:bifunctional aspartate kinase/homoserine dehydrogenase I n=1 Tax=Gallaecimonas sp. GXIMD4217 TaxID=3131927 RepID=UPI00311B411C
MKVMKFGGSSLADASRFCQVAELVGTALATGPVALVLSAPAGTTDALFALVEGRLEATELTSRFHRWTADLAEAEPGLDAEALHRQVQPLVASLERLHEGCRLLGQRPESVVAELVSLGERLSIALMEALLKARGHQPLLLDPRQLLPARGPVLDGQVDTELAAARVAGLPRDGLLLMPGYLAGDAEGGAMLLGRNGSDYSAALLAAALPARELEIWTDVDGVYQADPRRVPGARRLHSLSYAEALELCYFGAKVLHPKTLGPVSRKGIPVRIKQTDRPAEPGTLIGDAGQEPSAVKALSDLESMVMISVSGPGMQGMVGMAGRIFTAVQRAGVSIVLITQSSSEYSISFCVHAADGAACRQALVQEFNLELAQGLLDPIELLEQLAIITLVGDGMRHSIGVAGRFFSALARTGINVVAIAQGSSERSISAVVPGAKVNEGLRASHQAFFDSQQRIDLVLLGVGGVGSALLAQIRRQQAALAERQIRLNVLALGNSRQMLLAPQGVDLDHWQAQLAGSSQGFDLDALKALVREHHLINPVIADCTASEQVAARYGDFLAAGFHVVTPNKRANTGDLAYYRQLKSLCIRHKRKYLYETTVGAGLPVIENLQNLLAAGDRLRCFEGILSGSLSYICGKLEDGLPLSEATLMAKELGYTEPDPREDLSGLDVARKLLILAREAGLMLNMDDIEVEPLLPANACRGSLAQFVDALPRWDAHFHGLIWQAQSQGKVLRYVGSIEDGRCKVGLRAVAKDSPLATVRDGENALAFHSDYYSPVPLVLRGYGAGNEVTAAGVFADLLRTLNWHREG